MELNLVFNRRRLISAATSVFLLISILSSPLMYPKTANADGLFQEELSASFAGRTADLIIKMMPPVVTTETIQNQSQKPIIQFKLYDPSTQEGYKDVTYYITIDKDGKKLLSDWFHDDKGDLKIEMKPSNTETITVYGEPDPILQAFTGRENSPVVATGPIFAEGGLYHFIVRIATIDYARSFLPDDQQPEYEGWLSVGAVENQQVSVGNNTNPIPIQIISYYDELKDFNFDPSTKEMQFTMPFDWNLTRLQDNKVMVHQEILLPKPSELVANSYIGTINGIDVTKDLMIDPTNSTKDVVHFMIPKPVVMQIAEQVNNSGQAKEGLMKFTFKPAV
ncbi:MAG: hypothetical protein WA941_01995 [Nitrososphaeraceae archaeon]